MEPTQKEPGQMSQTPAEPQVSSSSSTSSGVRWVLVRAVVLSAIICVAVAVAIWLISIPLLSGIHAPIGIDGRPLPTAVPATTAATPTTNEPILTRSIEQLPRGSEVYVTVEPKDPGTSLVTVRFDGGPGRGTVKEIEVRLTRPDGSVVTGSMGTETVSPQVTLQGTKGIDRVEVFVRLYSGKVYKIIDENVPPRAQF